MSMNYPKGTRVAYTVMYNDGLGAGRDHIDYRTHYGRITSTRPPDAPVMARIAVENPRPHRTRYVTRKLRDVRPAPAGRFTLNYARLAELVADYPVTDDHSAFLALETAILGESLDSAVIQGGCELAVELLADGDGEIDGYRLLIHPSPDLTDPWIGGHIERVRAATAAEIASGGGYDPAEIIESAVQAANDMLAWYEKKSR